MVRTFKIDSSHKTNEVGTFLVVPKMLNSRLAKDFWQSVLVVRFSSLNKLGALAFN